MPNGGTTDNETSNNTTTMYASNRTTKAPARPEKPKLTQICKREAHETLIMSTTMKEETTVLSSEEEEDEDGNISDLPFSPNTLERKHKLEA